MTLTREMTGKGKVAGPAIHPEERAVHAVANLEIRLEGFEIMSLARAETALSRIRSTKRMIGAALASWATTCALN